MLFAATPRLVVTPLLIGVNVAVFVGMVALGASALKPESAQLLRWGANFGPQTLSGEWWRVVTSMFVHIGAMHLGLNMWCLWNLGQLAERMFGNKTFLLLYLFSGLGGSMASLAWDPTIVSAGASGAIFGVAGGLAGFWYFGKFTLPKEVVRRDLNSILSFVGYNLVIGFALGFVDNAAHLGGLVTGCILGALWHRSFPVTRRNPPRIVLVCLIALLAMAGAGALLKKSHAAMIGYQRGAKLLEAKQNEPAAEQFRRAIAADPDFASAYNDLGVACLRLERYEEAADALKKGLEKIKNKNDRAMALHNLGLAYQGLHQTEDAIEAMKKAIVIDPAEASSFLVLGSLYLSQNRLDEGIAAYESALKLDPNNQELKDTLAELKRASRR
jgi:rhomboid protease GluP